MQTQHEPETSGIRLTRKGERYCESAKATRSPASAFPDPRPASDSGQGGITRPAPAPRPRRKPLIITKARRAHIEAIVDQLLELLDAADGDADMEPSLGGLHSNPMSFGWGTDRTGHQLLWSHGDNRDLEDEHDGAEDGHDAEPSLGWTAFEARYGRYADRWFTDAEYEHDGREPDEGGLPTKTASPK